MSFDTVAYAAAQSMFERARKARQELPSLIAQAEDTSIMLSAPQLSDMPKGTSTGNATESAMLSHIVLVDLLKSKQSFYASLIADCESAIENMIEHDEGDGGDAAFLRYYYLQALTQEQAALRSGYSVNYRKEKGEVALLHVSYAVKRLGFC